MVLAGIHGYFGLHVLRRGIIFLDIALAQLAAFGAVLAAVMGVSLGTMASYWVSLGVTLIGAFVFTVTRSNRNRIPQEAVIGVSYVVAASAAIMMLSRLPGDAHHLKEMMVGNILFVWPPDLWVTMGLYAGVAVVHWVFKDQFWTASLTHPTGWRAKWWDFLFYATFGIVVTSSVKLAGVFLVFILLVAPAMVALLLVRRIAVQFWITWIVGAAVSGLGLLAAVKWDFPPGATIVVIAGAVLAGVGGITSVLGDRNP